LWSELGVWPDVVVGIFHFFPILVQVSEAVKAIEIMFFWTKYEFAMTF